ncbi:OB-fold domain-containing protein [Streptomyces sp. NPDC050803]|uniref:Zn-ribbon domain-containing OB-fold protein n=1 Tax=unclassified Streptomyces TaxID=2593676 RepID=UPI00342AD66B
MLKPLVDPDGAPFWQYAAQGELRVQACAGCGEPRFPPRPCCPHCRSFESDWRPVGGHGRIWSYVVPHPPLLPDYAEQAPYAVIVVELDEHPRIRLVGNLVAGPDAPLNSVPAERIRIGARVRVVFGREGLPQWVLERP